MTMNDVDNWLRCGFGTYLNWLNATKSKKEMYSPHVKAFKKKILKEFKKDAEHIKNCIGLLSKKNKVNITVDNIINGKGSAPVQNELTSPGWKKARYTALVMFGNICMCCRQDLPATVDHIIPRAERPELEDDIRNLQILCEPCNVGKGSWSKKDFRTEDEKLRAIIVYRFPHVLKDIESENEIK